MMMGEDSLDSGDQRDAYRLAVETAVEDDNRYIIVLITNTGRSIQ